MQTTTTQPERLLQVKEVSHLTGFGVSTVWRKTAEGKFPMYIKISPQVTRWRLSDVQAWIADPIGWNNESKEA